MCRSHLVLLQCCQRFVDAVDKLVDVFEVFGHLSGEDHVYDGLPERPVLVPVRERRRQQVCVKNTVFEIQGENKKKCKTVLDIFNE